MAKRLTSNQIFHIKQLRQKGWSLPEIQRETNVGHGTVFRYIKDVEILPKYKKLWFGKRGGSKRRKILAEIAALKQAKKLIFQLTDNERLLFLSALYWGEGSKSDFGLSNTDPDLIKLYVKGLKEIFHVPPNELRISIRIYEDLNKDKCLKFWSHITGIPISQFINVNILRGHKKGKLKYGMCRIRVTKGGNLLKYITAIKKQVINLF